MNKTQLNKLGERLRNDRRLENDFIELEEYRKAFTGTLRTVREALEKEGHEATERLKSLDSIVAKLKRGTTQLTQVQDIAGCRLVTADTVAQDAVVLRLSKRFENVRVIDRRVRPSHGYRAVHLLVVVDGRIVEIQVRSVLQHMWAENSEKLADRYGFELKYGGGPAAVRQWLQDLCREVREHESQDAPLAELTARIAAFGRNAIEDHATKVVEDLRAEFNRQLAGVVKYRNDHREDIEIRLRSGPDSLESTPGQNG